MLQTFAIPVGGRQINAKATFFKYETGNALGADSGLKVRANGNDLGVYYPGDSVELADAAERWELVPVSGATTGLARLGMGRVSSSRVAGQAETIDSGKARTMAGAAFTVTGGQPALAGQYARVGLWVPTGLTRRAVVERLQFSTTGASTTFHIGFLGAAPNIDAAVYNKRSAGAASIFKRAFENAGAIGLVTTLYVVNGQTAVIEPRTPLIVLPGNALLVVNATVNQDLYSNLDFYEEDNI